MDRNPIGSAWVVLLLVFLMVCNGCEASLLTKIRKLAGGFDPINKKISQQVNFVFLCLILILVIVLIKY